MVLMTRLIGKLEIMVPPLLTLAHLLITLMAVKLVAMLSLRLPGA